MHVEEAPLQRSGFLEALADPSVGTVASLCRRLGLVPRGGNYETLRRLAAQLSVSLPEPYRATPPRTGRDLEDVTEDQVRQAISGSRSLAGCLGALGVTDNDTNRRWLKRAISRLGVSTDHFVGRPRATDGGLKPEDRRGRPLTEILILNSTISTAKVRRRLIDEGVLPHRCARCERTRWLGRDIPLELDHVNGNRFDNRLENLRLLCPNCHALTPTYRGRNIGRNS